MGLRGLKAKRMLMGVTQQEISKKIGIACKTYNLKETLPPSRWERGGVRPY